MLKKTPLYDKHIELGARMVEYAGFEMPVYYDAITAEHMAVRTDGGIFDVSHMGEVIVEGENVVSFLQSILSNDVSIVLQYHAQYNCMPNDNGGIVDDLIIYRLEEQKFMLIVNAANIGKDLVWLEKKNENFGCTIINESDDWAMIAYQGPHVAHKAQTLTVLPVVDIPFYEFLIGEFAGVKDVIISATGYTGEGGFEFYMKNEDAPAIWDALINLEAKPCGLGARDTLRLEKGYCLYGNDIDETTSPIEAGLGWITKTKVKDFSSSDIFKEQKKNGVKRKLVGMDVDSKRIPRTGAEIVDRDGNRIGEVTSGAFSPMLDHPIAMGYVETDYLSNHDKVFISLGSKQIEGQIRKLPFYDRSEH